MVAVLLGETCDLRLVDRCFNPLMRPEPEIRTLAELCQVRSRTHADRPVVSDGTSELTYAQLASRAAGVAAFLRERGVQPGDRVVVHGRNSTAWVVAAFGVLVAGGTLVPLGHGATAAERDRFLDVLGPRLVLCDDDLLAAAGGVETVPFGRLCTLPEPDLFVPSGADPEAAALVLSSSGTTGAVKSVPMTHRQLLRLYGDVAQVMGVQETDRLLGAVPLAHSFGFNGVLLVAMLAGASVRLTRTYDRTVLAEVVRTGRVTVLAGPPTIYHDLAEAGPADVGPTPRIAIAGGQEVSAPELTRVTEALGIDRVVVGYGMTETCGTVAIGEVPGGSQEPLPRMRPMPGVEVRVCDDLDRDVVGEPGRVLVRGYNVARPYSDAPDLGAGGWFDTGDVGSVDAAGLLTIEARRLDTVIVSGFNVYPREVEAALAAHPDVKAVAVVGVPDRRSGERLVAGVVAGGDDFDPAALEAFARERLSAFKVPTHYVLLDELPVTSTGKLARSILRDLLGRTLVPGP